VTVQALVWKGDTALDYEALPDPTPAAGEVVLDVELAGICGSDLHGYRGHPGPRVPPLVLGHEAVGRLDGERFVVFPLIGCGQCERCRAGEVNLCPQWRLVGMHRAGVFAERVAVPRACLVPVPAAMSSERAVLTEPLACAVGALAPYAIGQGTRVVVIGCGPIGLLTVMLAAGAGAEVVAVDPLAPRRELAERLGARRTTGEAAELEQGQADLVIDAAGFQATWSAALSLVCAGGDVVVLGLGEAQAPFAMATLIRRGIRLRGQFAYSRADFDRALDTLATLDADLGWCATDELSQGARAFARLVEQPEEYVKILLAPGGR
jgi:threonine dehydrogenase-like Zn-dependent dehydrogenase